MTEQDRKDLLLLHAAGALDPAQEQAVNNRLAAGDPAVTGALIEAQSVLARLSGTCEPITPSPALRSHILNQISIRPVSRFEAQIDKLPDAAHAQASPSIGTQASAAQASRMRMPVRGGSVKPRWGRLALAAAVGGLVVGGPLGFVAFKQISDRAQAQAEVASRETELASLAASRDKALADLAKASATAEKARAAGTAAEIARKMEEIANRELSLRLADQSSALQELRKQLSFGDVKFTALSQPKGTGQPYGMVVWDVTKSRWLVYLFDMSPPPPGRSYQLWFLPEGGAPVPAPVFQVDAAGRATLSVELPKGMAKASAAITDEPPGGSKQPTGQIRLVGNL